MGLQAQTLPRDLEEWRRKTSGHHRLAIEPGLPLRQMLRQHFDQSRPERPNVSRRRQHSADGFRGIVRARLLGGTACFSDARYRVAGDLQMISYCQDIGGLQVAMHKTLAVEIFERVQNRTEHVTRLFRS